MHSLFISGSKTFSRVTNLHQASGVATQFFLLIGGRLFTARGTAAIHDPWRRDRGHTPLRRTLLIGDGRVLELPWTQLAGSHHCRLVLDSTSTPRMEALPPRLQYPLHANWNHIWAGTIMYGEPLQRFHATKGQRFGHFHAVSNGEADFPTSFPHPIAASIHAVILARFDKLKQFPNMKSQLFLGILLNCFGERTFYNPVKSRPDER